MENKAAQKYQDAMEEYLAESFGLTISEYREKQAKKLREVEQAQDFYNGEGGLSRLEKRLGLSTEGDESKRIDAISGEVARLVEKWEGMKPRELLDEHETINALFGVVDKAQIYNYVNKGQLPRCWWGLLVLKIDENGLYERLWDQIHRETKAHMTRQAGSEERRIGGEVRAAKDPKSIAMKEIRAEWEQRNRPGASFAREMAVKYQMDGTEISEGSIKNAIGRWRREKSSS